MTNPVPIPKAEKLRLLRADYGRSLPERLGALMHCWQALATTDVWGPAHADLLHRAHSLAGSAGTFGYGKIGAEAKLLEEILSTLSQTNAAPSDGQKATILEMLQNLWLILESGPDETDDFKFSAKLEDVSGKDKPINSRVALIEDDPLQAQAMAAQLSLLGWDVSVFASVNEAEAMAQDPAPAALIVDVNLPEGPLAGIDFIGKVHRQSLVRLPMIVISVRWDWDARLAAVRSGADAYLPKPVDIGTLSEHLDRITQRNKPEPYRVLIVDDDSMLVNHYVETLAAAGMASHGISESISLLTSMTEHRPELVLMDLYMPDCNGIEATRVIRQDPQYASLPIVFLTSEPGLMHEQLAFQTGNDDFLRKPISNADLVLAVSIRAERFRAMTALVRQDSMTGLYNHLAFKSRLDSEIDRSRRSKKPLSVIMLDIDNFKRVNDTYGQLQGDRVIKALAQLLRMRLRKLDIIGRYGGEEFAVAMPDTPGDVAATILNELREQFSQLRYMTGNGDFACSFSAGVVSCHALDGVASVLKTADQALHRAKESGRNRVERLG